MERILRVVTDEPAAPAQHISPGWSKCLLCGFMEPSEHPGWTLCECCKSGIRTVELGAVIPTGDTNIIAVSFDPPIIAAPSQA